MEPARKHFQPLNRTAPLSGGVLLVFLLSMAGCNPLEAQKVAVRAGSSGDGSMLGKAYIYPHDPLTASGDDDKGPKVDMGKYLAQDAQQITPAGRTTLTNDCAFQQPQYYVAPLETAFSDCVRVVENGKPGAAPLQSVDGTWEFEPNSSAFFQVNAMYQGNKVIKRMMDTMSFIHGRLHEGGQKSLPPSVPYPLADMGTWWFNYLAGTSMMTSSAQLSIQALGDAPNNAYYDPITNQVVLGSSSAHRKYVHMVQDPTILYHEMGHVFMTLFLNLRNAEKVAGVWQPLKYQAFPYYGKYDELGAMGEGIADYFAYAIGGLETMGTWGLGRFTNVARPLTEDHPLHAPGISSASDERVAYPDMLLYMPQAPGTPVEGVHNAGMITSHYLMALTDTLRTECSLSERAAVDHVMLLLAESFAYLGDLTGRGTDYNDTNDGTGKPKAVVNLHREGAYEWFYGTRRITMRRFFQTFSRNIHHLLTLDSCPSFTKEKSERLLDMYGLLLFRHYDDNGTFSSSPSDEATRVDAHALATPAGFKWNMINAIFDSEFGNNFPYAPTVGFPNTTTFTTVDEANRLRSVLIPKSALSWKTGGALATLLLDDTQTYAQNVAATTLFEGRVITPTTGIAGWEYNNSNRKISPGEVVGLVVDLVNNSSTPIGGVSILATPWAHMKVTNAATGKAQPCSINGFPSTSEGGLAAADCPDSAILPEKGVRFKKPTAGAYPSKALHPVCLVQQSSNNETRWVSQDDFRKNILQLEDKHCLGYGTPDFTPGECLMRFLPGKDAAFLAKIDPQKSYKQTVDPAGQQSTVTSAGLALEVNKWIPPGTMFTCRLRAQFSNCSDCFQATPTSDEYTDIEYGGAKPFRVLDVGFTILD